MFLQRLITFISLCTFVLTAPINQDNDEYTAIIPTVNMDLISVMKLIAKDQLQSDIKSNSYQAKNSLTEKLQLPLSGVEILEVGNKTYVFSPKIETIIWIQAYQFCKIYGMNLATVKTANEKNELTKFIQKKNETGKQIHYWIGGIKLFNDKFYWITGGAVNYAWMLLAEPKRAPNNCLEINRDGFSSYECEKTAGSVGYICEK